MSDLIDKMNPTQRADYELRGALRWSFCCSQDAVGDLVRAAREAAVRLNETEAELSALRAERDEVRARISVLEEQLAAARKDRDEAISYSKKMWHDRGLIRRQRSEDKSLKRTASKPITQRDALRAKVERMRVEALETVGAWRRHLDKTCVCETDVECFAAQRKTIAAARSALSDTQEK